MEALTAPEIRASFVNCTRGEAQRAHLPDDLDAQPWADLELLGWVDPRAPRVSYLVTDTDAHGRVGIQLRRNTSASRSPRMCSLCTTTHPGQGVSLMVARRAGRAGRDGNTVGLDICADLACSFYARGLRPVLSASAAHETLTVEERVARLRRNVRGFVDRVIGG